MMLNKVSAAEYGNPELAEKVSRVQSLTSGEYDRELHRQNEAALMKLLQGILRISRQEGEWFLYFYSLGEMLLLAAECYNSPVMVKCAEVYYRDIDSHGGKEVFYHAGKDESWINAWICANIFNVYKDCHQIGDAGMNAFMEKYEAVTSLYGGVWYYYQREMALGLLYWDEDMVEHGKKYFEKYENRTGVCYFCSRRLYAEYYLMKGQTDLAEEFMLLSLQKKVPKGCWCCDGHSVSQAYGELLFDCLEMGKPEAFRYFLEKYWLKQPEETWRELACKYTQDAYCGAIGGYFGPFERVLQLVQEDLRGRTTFSTRDNMLDFLTWWCYFRLLDRSGVHEVAAELTEVSQNKDGKVSCLVLGDFFEQLADDYGMKLERARAKFNYRDRKETFRVCAGL